MWNLDEGKKADATIALRLPRGWTADRTRADVTIPQMADLSVTFKLMPAAAVLGPEKLLVEGHCDGHAMASMVSWFGRKPAAVKPAKAEDVVKESGPDWELASPAAGQPTTSFERLRPGVFRIKSLPSAPEKRAISLKLPLGQGTRLDEFDGLLVTVEPAAVKPSFRVTLSDAQAAAWECGSAGDGHAPGSQLFLFRDMDWQWQSAPAFMPGLRNARAITLSCDFAKPVEEFTIRVHAVKYP